MKKINKKIGAVALSGMVVLGGSGLPQGFVDHANYTFPYRRTLLHANMLKNPPQGSGYNYVESQQYLSDFDAIYLGNATKFNKYIKRTYPSGRNIWMVTQHARHGSNNRIPNYYGLKNNHKYLYLSYKNGLDFLNNMDRLNTYRRQSSPIKNDPIVVKIENDYFAIFFNMTTSERNVLPIQQLIEPYGFSVEYGHYTGSTWGKAVFDSYIGGPRFGERNDVKNKQKWEIQHLIINLLKHPNNTEDNSYKNVFSDIEHFAYYLNNNRITIPNGFSRYRIGGFDYLFKK